MPSKRKRFGQVFSRKTKWYAKYATGRTLKGRTAYTTKAVASKREGEDFLRAIRKAMLTGSLQPKKQKPKIRSLRRRIRRYKEI